MVAGDVEGQYDVLFNRVSSINKKSGPFDMLLCVGDFFSTSTESQFQSYTTKEKKSKLDMNFFCENEMMFLSLVPIPTFILGPSRAELDHFIPDLKGCELCPNLTYLGKQFSLKNLFMITKKD